MTDVLTDTEAPPLALTVSTPGVGAIPVVQFEVAAAPGVITSVHDAPAAKEPPLTQVEEALIFVPDGQLGWFMDNPVTGT